MKRIFFLSSILLAVATYAGAQNIKSDVVKNPEKPTIAVPIFAARAMRKSSWASSIAPSSTICQAPAS